MHVAWSRGRAAALSFAWMGLWLACCSAFLFGQEPPAEPASPTPAVTAEKPAEAAIRIELDAAGNVRFLLLSGGRTTLLEALIGPRATSEADLQSAVKTALEAAQQKAVTLAYSPGVAVAPLLKALQGAGAQVQMNEVANIAAVVPAEKPANANVQPAVAKPEPPSERIIYIPYSKLNALLEQGPRQVLVPLAEYERLLEIARNVDSAAAKPPVPAVITSILYQGQIVGDTAALQVKLEVEVLGDDWVRLPIRFPGAALSEVAGATLEALPDGTSRLLLQKRGRHQVAFTASMPVTASPQGKTLSISGPTASKTSLELTIPEENLEVEVQPKLATTQRIPGNKQTKVIVIAGVSDKLTVSWRAKSEGVMVQEALAIATNDTRVQVADGVIHTRAQLDYQLLRGELSEIPFVLPADEKLLDVKAPGLRDWKAVVEGGVQKVTVRLYSPVRTKLTLLVESERAIPAGPFAVGTIRAGGVQRETGVLTVVPGEELSLAVVERENVTRVAPEDVAENQRRAGGLYYKFYSNDFNLKVQVAPVAPRVAVVSRFAWRLEEANLQGDVDFAYDIQRTGIFSTRIQLPKGLVLEGVSGPDVERHELTPQADGQLLTVHFRKKVLGAETIHLNLSQPRPDPNAALDLPLPQPLEVDTERGVIAVSAHESFEVNTDPAKTTGVRTAIADELVTDGLVVNPQPRMVLAASFRYLARPISVGLIVKKRRTRVVADTFTLLEVKENNTHTSTTIVYEVQYAGTDTLQLEVPAAVADRIEISGANIKEKRRGEAKDELVPWTVVLHTSTLGRHPLTVSFNDPLDLSKPNPAAKLYLARPTNVERENGQIAVVKQRDLSLEEKPENLEAIDPRMLQIPSEVTLSTAQSEFQFAYRYYRHPVSLSLPISKHEIQRVVETIISRALIETLVPEEGPLTYRAQYSIKSSQRQRLTVLLPKGSKFLGLSVAGKNVLPENATQNPNPLVSDAYLVNVSRSTGANDTFPLTILFEQPRAAGRLTYFDQLPLAMPQFGGDVTFQRIFWQIWLPQRFSALGAPAGFTDENQSYRALSDGADAALAYNHELNNWTREWSAVGGQSVFEFPTVGQPFLYSTLIGPPTSDGRLVLPYVYMPTLKALSSFLVLLLVMISLRWVTPARLTLLLVVTLAIFLGGLFAPEATYRVVAAGYWGVGIGLIVVIISSALQLRQNIATAWVQREKLRHAAANNSADKVVFNPDFAPEAAEKPGTPPDTPPASGPSSDTTGQGG